MVQRNNNKYTKKNLMNDLQIGLARKMNWLNDVKIDARDKYSIYTE